MKLIKQIIILGLLLSITACISLSDIQYQNLKTEHEKIYQAVIQNRDTIIITKDTFINVIIPDTMLNKKLNEVANKLAEIDSLTKFNNTSIDGLIKSLLIVFNYDKLSDSLVFESLGDIINDGNIAYKANKSADSATHQALIGITNGINKHDSISISQRNALYKSFQSMYGQISSNQSIFTNVFLDMFRVFVVGDTSNFIRPKVVVSITGRSTICDGAYAIIDVFVNDSFANNIVLDHEGTQVIYLYTELDSTQIIKLTWGDDCYNEETGEDRNVYIDEIKINEQSYIDSVILEGHAKWGSEDENVIEKIYMLSNGSI